MKRTAAAPFSSLSRYARRGGVSVCFRDASSTVRQLALVYGNAQHQGHQSHTRELTGDAN